MVHIFRRRDGVEGISLKERFCRPGAVFGPERLEEQLGVEIVYHEQTKRLPSGRAECKTCNLVEA
jgi:hypothetical protein